MNISKAIFRSVLILLAAFPASPLAVGQELQMTPRDAYESIPTRTSGENDINPPVILQSIPQKSDVFSRSAPDRGPVTTPAPSSDIVGGMSSQIADPKLPASVDLRKYLPAPGKQQDQNDCVAWALGYSSYSCQICQERNRAPNAECDKFSPAFIYNSLQKDGKGLNPLDAIRFVKETGCASMATVPQNSDRATQTALTEAATFRAADHERAENLDDIKAYLHDGYPVMLVVFLDAGFMNYAADDSPYLWAGTKTNGLHAISAVGYNDDKQAVLIMNSSGTEWKDSGFCWVSYKNLKSIDKDSWCVEAHVIKVKNSHPVTVRTKGRFPRYFTMKNDHVVYEKDQVISPANWQLDDMVYAQDGLFVLRDTRTLALMSENKSQQTRDWLHLDFGDLKTEVIAMLAADASSLLRVLTDDGDVFEYRPQTGDALGLWQKINPPSSDTSRTVDLRMAGIELRATNQLGQVYVYNNNGVWTLAK